MLLKLLSKIELHNYETWLQVWFLDFLSLPDYYTKQTKGTLPLQISENPEANLGSMLQLGYNFCACSNS